MRHVQKLHVCFRKKVSHDIPFFRLTARSWYSASDQGQEISLDCLHITSNILTELAYRLCKLFVSYGCNINPFSDASYVDAFGLVKVIHIEILNSLGSKLELVKLCRCLRWKGITNAERVLPTPASRLDINRSRGGKMFYRPIELKMKMFPQDVSVFDLLKPWRQFTAYCLPIIESRVVFFVAPFVSSPLL